MQLLFRDIVSSVKKNYNLPSIAKKSLRSEATIKCSPEIHFSFEEYPRPFIMKRVTITFNEILPKLLRNTFSSLSILVSK